MNTDIEFHIRNNYSWNKVPPSVKQSIGNSHKDYDKCILSFSIKNQLRHKGNLVRHVFKDEKQYYDDLLKYSQEHLMLYPYHLADVVVKGLRVTPFQYYISMMQDIMQQEKSYDSLPNFTAADCLRLLGIGRNQYIDLMNQCRSSKRFFRRRSLRDLLPVKPIDDIVIEPWWMQQAGYITEDDIKIVTSSEKELIDAIIDEGAKRAGDYQYQDVHGLYLKGLIYLDVPITDNDYIIVPPLEGFVMNRVQGDYFETLLYKIFVSIDENTSVYELASVLQIDSKLVKNAVSMYCRLGFAKKKFVDESENHPSWSTSTKVNKKNDDCNSLLITKLNQALEKDNSLENAESADGGNSSAEHSIIDEQEISNLPASHNTTKRIGFLFDSTLTAFLMMGNLSPGLKSHAVTMFEVGKLTDETLDSFVTELDKVSANIAEGEAQRYFEHALTLRNTISVLRHNVKMSKQLESKNDCYNGNGLGLDLIRCESLQSLDPGTCTRLLNKNYRLLVSMAPLTHEIRPVSSCSPPHIGPAIPEANSVWFKLFIYCLTKCGPPSLLLVKGFKLKRLPRVFKKYERLLITTWGHDPGIVPTSNAILTINDALSDSAVLIQAHCNKNGSYSESENLHIPFPFDENSTGLSLDMRLHPAIESLLSEIDLRHTCGYITMVYNPDQTEYNIPNLHSCSSVSNSPSSGGENVLPVNGISNKHSAALLESELEILNDEIEDGESSNVKPNLTIDIVDNSGCDSKTLLSDWTLLNCSFGVPLFDKTLNIAVCNKIVSCGLCGADSLNASTQSSRKMCLRLLKFVADNQISSVTLDTRESNETSIFDISLPTKSLLFANGKLMDWDGW
ncbi:FAM91A1 (predicted) [Pycnogonum litorale]